MSLRTSIFWSFSILLLAGSAWVHWRYGSEGIGVFGSYASVLGLIVTFYVAESVRKVRDRYTVRITLMQNFERLKSGIRRFEEASKANEIQAIAGEIYPLIEDLGVHLPHDVRIESVLASLQELKDCRTAQSVQNTKLGIPAMLRHFATQVEIHRDKDEWRRDHA